MEPLTSIASIAQEIQLSVAPVFLLTGIAGMLAVLSGRLGRVIDRARAVQAAATSADDRHAAKTRRDSLVLRRRIWLIQWAIRLYVCAALIICLVIVALFIGDYVAPDLSLIIASLFILTMFLMVVGLFFFLHEMGLATRQIETEIETLLKADMS